MATIVNGSTGVSQVQETVTLKVISTGSVPSLEAKGTSGVTSGYLELKCSENTHGIKLLGPPHSAGANYTLTFPNNDGDANQFLQTNGSGVMSWAAAGGGLTLLSTVATTTGATATTGSLDFSSYQQLHIVFNQVGHDHSGGAALNFNMNGNGVLAICAPIATGKSIRSHVLVDLNTNIIIFSGMPDSTTQTTGNSNMDGGGVNSSVYKVGTNLKSASGTVACSWVGGYDFNVASSNFLVYGLK